MPASDKHPSKVKILLADDHIMLRQVIRVLLERESDFDVVAEASDGEEAARLCDKFKPDVVLMDVAMPNIGGLEATKKIKSAHPDIAVLVLTIHDDEEYIIGFFEAGAAGYLVKSAYGEELVQAIRSLHAGDVVVHPLIMQKMLNRLASHKTKPVKLKGVEQLTPREIEVLKLLASGISNRDIALDLSISVRAVKAHLTSIFAKIEVRSRTEATLFALKQGWVVLDGK